MDLLVRTDNVALEEKSGLLSHVSTAALLAVIAVLLAAGIWLLLNWKKMKIKSKKSCLLYTSTSKRQVLTPVVPTSYAITYKAIPSYF